MCDGKCPENQDKIEKYLDWPYKEHICTLQTVVANDQKDWSSKCPMVEFAINSSINTTTGYTPFKLNYGYMLQFGQHISTDTTFKGVKQFSQ